MRKIDLFREVLAYLAPIHGNVETELHFQTPFQLLVATVLSAQCTDKRVNMVTPALFESFPTPVEMSQATPEAIFEYIRSVSYPNAKAKHLVELAKMLVEKFQGEVPQTLEQLTQLPGVGRKTANVVLAVAFGQAALAVDTHIYRVAHRLGLVPASANTPYKVEMALRKFIPEEDVAHSHFWLLLHGRYTCTALRPKCEQCGLSHLCKGPIKAKAK
ncbi:endonuclease III [Alloprevotella rava]|uniref:Endonuclease III n=2 Tax=Alloprevotella rava TaxID=671218 RepID=G5GDN5_9BACT|nr:endonuclease III [Alloprevotella rava]EHG21740.1 endonuclease III [Alloprevotella rava F0323]MBB3701628.1 endonuclease-3 [Alloprevotella rava]